MFAQTSVRSGVAAKTADLIPPNDPRIAVMGRVDATNPTRIRVGYPGVTFRVRFSGSSLAMRAASNTPNSFIAVIVDDGEPRLLRLPAGENEVTLADGLDSGEHTIDIVHQTETWVGVITVLGFRLAPGGTLLPPNPWPRRRIMFIGDSVTCGEAMKRAPNWKDDRPASWDAYHSYGMLLARKLDAQVHLVCFGGRGLVRDWRGRSDVQNAPQFFDLSLPDETSPPLWNHNSYIPDGVVVSLGTNDFNFTIGEFPERESWVSAYVRFVRAIRSRYPDAHILLTEGSIVDDVTNPQRPRKSILAGYIKETVSRLADPRVHCFESQHYPGDATDAHPTAAQHAAMARDIEPIIRAEMGW